ncbi:uncharacterized protein LOC125075376 [Vanessa atalanta]|uniref:uncharacterized protein LOC125075376 n=1 Tax=Vanessa atalanta TaxID=42275 RepID=UPI001FCD2B5F|nr:uncharacterized protein LOC125075376 [Vanessa atalanta]
MRVLPLSFLLTLLDTTKASKGSSVDLALETVLEFNDAVDSGVLDKIKGIINDIRNTFKENPEDNVPDEKKKPYNFIDFLKDAIIATNSYKDDELVELLDIIHSEINEMDLKDVDYIRDYLKNNIANMKRDSRKARNNLDNLLSNLRNTNGDVNSSSEKESDEKDRTNEIIDGVKSDTRYKRTTQRNKSARFRSKAKTIGKVKDDISETDYDSTAEKSSQSASGSDNSEQFVQNIENAEKKKLIEKKMKEDLDSLFSTTTTSTTTEAYADIFKGMEDEFDLS